MKKRTRRILFWFAVIAFGLISWIAIKYARGYVFDFETNTFVRTGAIAVTVNTDATLYIDDQKIGDTSFIGNRVGEDGLVPDTYTIRVEHDGYSTWRKVATVQEGMLVDFPSVMLLPTEDAESQIALKDEAAKELKAADIGSFVLKNGRLLTDRTASASLLAENVLGAALADNGSKLLWWTRNELWVFWLRNTDKQPYHSEGDTEAITRFSVPIVGAAWFRDDEHIVVDLGRQTYRVIEIDTRGGTNIIRL